MTRIHATLVVLALAVNNRITDADIGIAMNTATVKYRDNLTTGVPFPYTGGTRDRSAPG